MTDNPSNGPRPDKIAQHQLGEPKKRLLGIDPHNPDLELEVASFLQAADSLSAQMADMGGRGAMCIERGEGHRQLTVIKELRNRTS